MPGSGQAAARSWDGTVGVGHQPHGAVVHQALPVLWPSIAGGRWFLTVACPVSGTGGEGAQGTACATLGSDGLVGARWGGGYQGGGRQWGRTSGDRQQYPSEGGTQCNGIVLLWAGCDPVP